MLNQKVAGIFFEIADMLEMQGIQWKPRAYRAAARAIEAMPQAIEEVHRKGGRKALEEIPGVGEAIARKTEEIIKTGKLPYYQKLRKGMPINLDELEKVPGLGPKKLMLLYRKLGVRNLKDLRKAAEQHKIKKLPGFAEKSELEILNAIVGKEKKGGRVPFSTAKRAADKIVAGMKKVRAAERVEVGGSLRRKRPTIGDIDVLVASRKPEAVTKAFVSMKGVKKVLASGPTKSSVVLSTGMQSDLRVVKPEQWGSALLYFTGSKQHSIELRKIAIKRGMKLSEYGLFKKGKVVASRTEREIFRALGVPYKKPEERG